MLFRSRLADLVASNLGLKVAEAQGVLETHNSFERLKKIYEILAREIEVLTIQAKIRSQAKDEMTKSQKEYFLREQIRAIKSELGDGDPVRVYARRVDTNETYYFRVGEVAIATASVNGQSVTREVNPLGPLDLAAPPKLRVSLAPDLPDSPAPAAGPSVITVTPGSRAPAWLRIQRQGHAELVTFFVEGLPHGVIVDDIGLSGVLIPKGENERRIFLNCAKWVPEQDRWCYAIEQQAGRQTSQPILLQIRRPPVPATTPAP